MTFGSFDIECTAWDQFVCGAIKREDGTTSVYWSEIECFRAVASYEGTLWTWAGGRYDMVWLCSVAKMLGVRCEARMSGGQIVVLQLGDCTVRDGFKLYPVPLAIAAQFAGVSKLATGFDCVCTADCGGYCAITRRMSRTDRDKLATYLVGDLEATSATVEALHAFAAQHDIVIKATVGASAWATLKAMGAPKAKWKTTGDYMFARLGYYGGRTEVYQIHAEEIYGCDINSAYPAALRDHAVPTGEYRRLAGTNARKALGHAGGVFAARVRVPDMYVPPLPNRGVDRLLFATGVQSGHWTGVELRSAEEVGVEILDVTSAIVWDREEKVCAPFMEKFWGLRAHYDALEKQRTGDKKAKSPQGAWLKWFVNSLTGKLAMHPEGEKIIGNPAREDVKGCPGERSNWCMGVLCRVQGACCPHACLGDCGKWLPIDKQATLWSAPTFSLPDCGHVQWSATLTTHTRIELGAQLRHADQEAVACDTDSVKATRQLTRRIGDELGEWKDEGRRVDHFGPFPKAYRNADPETGEYECKAKGVPDLDAIRFDRWAKPWRDSRGRFTENGRGVKLDRGVWGVKGGARKGEVFQRKDITRHVRSDGTTVGSRVVLSGGKTRPMSLSEYKSRAGKERAET